MKVSDRIRQLELMGVCNGMMLSCEAHRELEALYCVEDVTQEYDPYTGRIGESDEEDDGYDYGCP